jgi:hypothetical protein
LKVLGLTGNPIPSSTLRALQSKLPKVRIITK